MDPAMWPMIGFAAVTLIVNILVLSIGGTWKLAGLRDQIRQDFEKKVDKFKSIIDHETDTIRREVGELGHSLRQQILNIERDLHAHEKYVRDEFIRKDSFREFADRISAQITTMDSRGETRFAKMEQKMDATFTRGVERIEARAG